MKSLTVIELSLSVFNVNKGVDFDMYYGNENNKTLEVSRVSYLDIKELGQS